MAVFTFSRCVSGLLFNNLCIYNILSRHDALSGELALIDKSDELTICEIRLY